MKRLWTPWRMAYLRGPKNPEPGCIFCDKVRADPANDRDNLLVWRGERSFIALNLYPYANGHLLVAPYVHTGDLESLDAETSAELMALVGKGISALRQVMNPQGFNVGMNLGRVAGAGIENHVHWHIVPRWNGDTNFMPILAQTTVLPQALNEVADSLRAALTQ